MKQSNLYALLLLLLIVGNSPVMLAQEKCAATTIHQEFLQSDPAYAQRIEANERELQKMIAERSASRSSTGNDTIPVVVHVLHTGQAVGTGANISEAQIQSAIDQLNAVFADYDGNGASTTIRFALAKRDPTGCSATNGINRINATGVENYENVGIRTDNSRVNLFNLSRWNTEEYLNIWVVTEINNNNGGAGTQGFATFPDAPHQYDGVVCIYNTVGYDPDGSIGYNLKSYTNENDVVVHEVGHYLNLYHTFQGDDSNNDGVADTCPSADGCGADGDCISDTDPHQRTTSLGCIDFALNTCSGDLYGEVLHNYMAYSHEACKTEFTPEQVGRMEVQMVFGRKGLVSSSGLKDISIDEPPMACIPQTSSTGTSGNYGMGITEISLGDWITYSGNTFEDGGYHYEDQEFQAAYYRIKQVDHDGLSEYSDIRFVRALDKHHVFNIYPNPTDDVFRICSSLDISEKIEMKLIGLTGRVLFHTSGTIDQLNQLIAQDFRNIPDGVYLVQLAHAGVRSTERLVVNRR